MPDRQARRAPRSRAALRSLDETLCLFDPAAVPDAIEHKVWRPKADWAKRGEMTRLCLDIVRRASGPVCNRDIAFAFMTAREMDTNDERLVRLVAKCVGCCMRGHRDAGLVTGEDGPGQTVVWRLTESPCMAASRPTANASPDGRRCTSSRSLARSIPTNTGAAEERYMTRPCEYGLAGRRPERLFGFESGWADGAPSSVTGSLTPGGHGLPSAPKLAARGELGN
jgi:hypothetical protein